MYQQAENLLYLLSDVSGQWQGGLHLGVPGTFGNSQCTIDGGASSSSQAGNNLTLNLAVTFKTPFAGLKNAYLTAFDRAGQSSGSPILGTWTVPSTNTPNVVSVSPVSGSGSGQVFTAKYGDANGFADINEAQLMLALSQLPLEDS
jgi:hypothetical protein